MSIRLAMFSMLFAAAASTAAAQQQGQPALGDLARQVEAERAKPKKPARTYTNADLATIPVLPPPATETGFMSNSLGVPVSAEQVVAQSQGKVARDEAPPEARWRQRADGIRAQVEKMVPRLGRLTSREKNPNAAIQKSTEDEIKMLRDQLAQLAKRWASLEQDARTSKIPLDWIEPAPQFAAQ